MRLFTIGHSNQSMDDFMLKLKKFNIEILVDIRSYPQSKYVPHFNRDNLDKVLEDNKIAYTYNGRNIGGKDVNYDFNTTVNRIAETVKSGKRICLMCTEGNHKKCHRFTILEPEFKVHNVDMFHLF